MKNVKFRAWHKAEKKMCNIKVITFGEGAFLVGVYTPMEGRFCMNDEFELLQFTGLLDRNGKEVFEGDIIKLNDMLIEITFSDGGFQMKSNDNQGRSDACQERLKKFEVIGNIYSDPELINQ